MRRTAPGAAVALAAALAVALAVAGCSRPTTHHRPGTSHDTATAPVAPATQPPDESGSDLHDQGEEGHDADSGSGSDSGSKNGDTDPQAAGTQADETVRITVADGRVSPSPGRVEVREGDRVALVVTSDTADELHVHGLDKTAALAAGRTTTLTFTADRTGVFEVETHESGLVLTQLLVR
ncbi:cupredoxin domain-containing protein [Streptomyces sp. NPDC051940]|uniref:cupredoxin domain-containing protein n=1 Tax=Streptomyces sp. NPDC051940 TaxID=3155675 RepID=UPI0034172F1D